MLRLSFLGILLWMMMMMNLAGTEKWWNNPAKIGGCTFEEQLVLQKEEPLEEMNYSREEMPYLAECEDIDSKTERRQCSDRKIIKFLMDNFQLPLDSDEGCSKMMVASFIVGIDGTISKPQIRRGVNPELDAELLRVIKILPKFAPGRWFGKAIPIEFNLPFRIRVE